MIPSLKLQQAILLPKQGFIHGILASVVVNALCAVTDDLFASLENSPRCWEEDENGVLLCACPSSHAADPGESTWVLTGSKT